MESKKLSVEFVKFGDRFRQLKRDDTKALYVRENPVSGKVYGYDVIKVSRHKEDAYIGGRKVASAGDERYPSTNEFWASAWDIVSIERAEAKYNSI